MAEAGSHERKNTEFVNEPSQDGRRGRAASEEGELGRVCISTHVIAMLARAAILGVPGVAGMQTSLAGRVAAWLGAECEGSGIKVEKEADGISIDARILVVHGVPIPDVVWQVQCEVRRRIKEITGKTVRTVNVVVMGVETPSTNSMEDSE